MNYLFSADELLYCINRFFTLLFIPL